MRSIFEVLKKEDLTTLKLRYDFRTGIMNFMAAKEWEKDTDFSRFNKDFYVGSVMTADPRYYGTEQVREIFAKQDALDYLDQVADLLRQGKHYGLDCSYYDKHNIRFAGGLHSPRMGTSTLRAYVFGGGIRRHEPNEPELDVITDGLNLARAMSFKWVAIKLTVGGAKTVVQMDPVDLSNLEILGFLGYGISSMRCCTSADMGFPLEMNDAVVDHGFSAVFQGGTKARVGVSGPPTSYGTYLAMKEAVGQVYGTKSLEGLTVAVQGLGNVGAPLAEYVLEEGGSLIIADIDPARVKSFIDQHAAKNITAVGPEEVLRVKCDVLAPCSVGGVLSDETIPELDCRVVFGAANNQLKATNQETEIRLANKIADRGILFQEAWWHNGGGAWSGTYENDRGAEANLPELMALIGEVVPAQTRSNLAKAKELHITPTECMYRTVEAILYGEAEA